MSRNIRITSDAGTVLLTPKHLTIILADGGKITLRGLKPIIVKKPQ